MLKNPTLELTAGRWYRDSIASAAQRIRRRFKDSLIFFTRWLQDPAGIAAVMPSSRALARLITSEIDGSTGSVLELGSGTGAFVPALLKRGIAENGLTLIERDPVLATHLTQRYPLANIHSIDAVLLGDCPHGCSYGAVICGLGLLNMRASDVEEILVASFWHMAPDAGFFLFTYGRGCSVPDHVLDRLGLRADRVGTALWNLPPATVFRITRSQPSGLLVQAGGGE